jgi:hypothetical protein
MRLVAILCRLRWVCVHSKDEVCPELDQFACGGGQGSYIPLREAHTNHKLLGLAIA